MPEFESASQFATYITARLTDAGFQAFWAGGCVRDRLLGQTPKDYDVATDATPKQIRRLFRAFQTLSIGESFGVVVVVGPKKVGTVEVATFRRDSPYSDGRHPDYVVFSCPEEDAQRRDFTINGIFYDPIGDRVIDFVGGQADLKARMIRAIGDPNARFAEDKLRMLRAVRFAATLDFTLDSTTKAAIAASPANISTVSAERIAQEMRRMLESTKRATAVRLLRETRLLPEILPEATLFDTHQGQPLWQSTLKVLQLLDKPTFPVAFAALLSPMANFADNPRRMCKRACGRWKLSRDDTDQTTWLILNESHVRDACNAAWPKIQRLLIHENAKWLVDLAEAINEASGGDPRNIQFCREKLALPKQQLDPPALIDGDDLIEAGLRPGKLFSRILTTVRDAQLRKRISSKSEAIRLAKQIAKNA